MCRCRMGNPKRSSRFICCKCLKENQLGSGIQRANQRSKYHIKDLTCLNPGCDGMITKNIEVRYCDNYQEMMDKAEELHREYYGKEDGIMREWKFENKIEVFEEEFDNDLHCLKVYNGDNYLGTIYPATIEDMESYFKDLDNEKDPITSKWEDGCGNTCTLDGWGE